MSMLRTSNPIFRAAARAEVTDTPVTYANVTWKTVLLALIVASAGVAGLVFLDESTYWVYYAAIPVAFVSSLLGIFIRRAAAFFSILYAAAEGLVLGLITVLFEAAYPGIAFTAISTTVIVMLIMMLLYSARIVKVGSGFYGFLVVAMISTIVMSIALLFTPYSSSLYYFVCIASAVIATLYLFLDFANVERCVAAGVDKSVGWQLALGLMVSLVWLYVEILRLLAIFAGRRR